VRGLAKLAGVSGDVSLRELMELLGPAEFAPRPVYVLGHNTNSHAEVIEAFEAGANGLEIDITPYAMRPDELCVAHRGGAGNGYGVEEDPPLVSFLQFLREQAEARGSQFALLMLDVKPYATKPEHGKLMLEAVRDHLIDEANPINLIISTARFDYRSLFQKIAPMLRPREAIMIDEEDEAGPIEKYFTETLGLRPQGYGNGSSVFSDMATDLRTGVQNACWIRAQRGGFNFVYSWVVNASDNQLEWLKIGVDGMVTDDCNQLFNLVKTGITPTRMATRSDNPFMPSNAAYGLKVKTGANGTDSDIKFTLHGEHGSASIVYNSGHSDRMELGQTNYIVLPSRDLGELTSISVQSDQSGIFSDWWLDTIQVESYRYGVNKSATFNRLIDSTAELSKPLV